MLGEEQWQWLEETLKKANETFIFIGSGTQILPFNRLATEAWYGTSRDRLFDLIGKVKKNGIILLSGDIHCAEILKTFCVHPDIGYNLYEFSSSGLSHYCIWKFFFENLFAKDYSLIPHLDYYNFGMIEFDWGISVKEAKVNLKITDIDNNIYANLTLSHEELSYNPAHFENEPINPYLRDCKTRLNSKFKSFWEYYYLYKSDIPGLLFMIGAFILLFLILFIVFFVFKFSITIIMIVFNKLYLRIKSLKSKTE